MRHRLTVLVVGAALVAAPAGQGLHRRARAAARRLASRPPAVARPHRARQRARRPVRDRIRARGRHDGGTLIIGDWQEANLFNPFYLSQQTEANAAIREMSRSAAGSGHHQIAE